jgi:hypothetical protein
MRITIELPDDLLRRIKVQAALTDRKLKVLVPELLETGLSHQDTGAAVKSRPRGKAPALDRKTPVRRRA